MIKKIAIAIVLIITIVYYRYDFTYMLMSGFGQKPSSAHKIALLVSDKPVQYFNSRISSLFERLTKDGLESHLNTAILVRNDFSKKEQESLYSDKFEKEPYKEKNYKNEYSPVDKKIKSPIFQWDRHLDSKLIIESKPQLCGGKLIYAVPEGKIGALNYKTGETIWTKSYEEYSPVARRGFTCKYNASIDANVIYVPTSMGILCLNSEDGSSAKSICNEGVIKSHKSLIPPIIDKNSIYIATISPAGVEAHDINSGNLLWRTEFEVGSAFLGGGSNPWSGFTFDAKTNLIFVNTGSPPEWTSFQDLDSKFKYTNSLIALNAKSGDIAWQFQERSQDYWDLDMVSKPINSPVKINNKEIIITLSKSGSIYFLDKNTGKPVFKVIERKTNIGGLSYFVKESITPKSLLSTSILNSQCSNCNLNTKVEIFLPPLLKKIRKFDGYSGGIQWPGGTIDSTKKLLIVSSNRNIITEHYFDFAPYPKKNISSKKIFNSCFKCHSKAGNVVHDKNIIYPSLFLTTKIHSLNSFKEFMEANEFHKDIKQSPSELSGIYDILLNYDNTILSEKSYQMWGNIITHKAHDKKLSSSSPFGLITAISLETGDIVWQINAGTFSNENGDSILGSVNYAGVSASPNDPTSVFTGSYDKLAYGIDNKNGKILWKLSLPASGSAPPYIYETDKDKWIFIVSSGGRAPGDKSDVLTAFKQSKGAIDGPSKKTVNQITNLSNVTEVKKILDGVYLYNNNCAACHGLEGIGTAQGPSLLEDIYSIDRFSDEDFLKVFENGAAQKNWDFGPMPAQFQVPETEAKIILNHIRHLQNF